MVVLHTNKLKVAVKFNQALNSTEELSQAGKLGKRHNLKIKYAEWVEKEQKADIILMHFGS